MKTSELCLIVIATTFFLALMHSFLSCITNERSNNYKGPIQIFHGEPCSFVNVTVREQLSFTISYYNKDKAKLVMDIVKQIKLAEKNLSSSVQQ